MRWRVLVLAILAALASGCSAAPGPPDTPGAGPDPPSPEPPAPVPSVSIEPSSASIGVGETVQLTATVTPSSDAGFTWASSELQVATVSSSGLVEGLARGQPLSPPRPPAPPPAASVTLVGAGDIAGCSTGGDEATAALLDGFSDATVFTLAAGIRPRTDYTGRTRPRGAAPEAGGFEY